jgi:rhodanese-related sulfurtransferase
MAGLSARVFTPGFAGWAGDPRDPVVRLLEAQELEGMLRRDQQVDERGERPRLEDRLPKGFILLDLREDWDYGEEHVPGAYSLPERRFSERFEAVLRERWPHADPRVTPLVLYCYGRGCTRSRNCATVAAQKGFAKLLWFREGMDGWSAIDGPVFPTPTGGASTPSRPRARPDGRP